MNIYSYDQSLAMMIIHVANAAESDQIVRCIVAEVTAALQMMDLQIFR